MTHNHIQEKVLYTDLKKITENITTAKYFHIILTGKINQFCIFFLQKAWQNHVKVKKKQVKSINGEKSIWSKKDYIFSIGTHSWVEGKDTILILPSEKGLA